jgi:methionyl-tRNA formyltransferase
MRLLFFGTPLFAKIALERLLSSRHRVEAVVTAPDKPKGRGQKVSFPEVKALALSRNLQVLQPEKLKDPLFLERVTAFDADLFSVVAFRILPEKLFSIPRFGAINLHASLLPAYRGAAPIERALMDGATRTGVTTFQIAKDVDTGNLLLRREVAIGEQETYEDLYPRLAEIGAELLVETIDGLEHGSLTPRPQTQAGVSTAPKIVPEESLIDWTKPSTTIVNQIRGLAGSADAYTFLGDKRLKVLRATEWHGIDGIHTPGELVHADASDGLIVASGTGGVRLDEVCLEGKKRMSARVFLNGMRLRPGIILAAS